MSSICIKIYIIVLEYKTSGTVVCCLTARSLNLTSGSGLSVWNNHVYSIAEYSDFIVEYPQSTLGTVQIHAISGVRFILSVSSLQNTGDLSRVKPTSHPMAVGRGSSPSEKMDGWVVFKIYLKQKLGLSPYVLLI